MTITSWSLKKKKKKKVNKALFGFFFHHSSLLTQFSSLITHHLKYPNSLHKVCLALLLNLL